MKLTATAALVLAVTGGLQPAAGQDASDRAQLLPTAGPVASQQAPSGLSLEEKAQRRYPQPVRVGDVIGLPVLDLDDRTLGRVASVVRTPDGKIKLIVPYGGFLGWGRRPVAVPVEAVAIAGRQLSALDMTRAEFDSAPAWNEPQSPRLPASDTIRIGLYRR